LARRSAWLLLGVAAAGCASAPKPVPVAADAPAPSAPPPSEGAERIADAASRLAPEVGAAFARAFVSAAETLPYQPPRTLYRRADKSAYWSAAEAAKLPPAERAALVAVPATEELYYNPPQYGDALAYARLFEVLAEGAGAGLADWEQLRVFDFGYGGIAHLKMLAALGADATGVDPDPMLRALYSEPTDQGPFGPGRVRVIAGRFPAEPEVLSAVGGGYDLVLAKNVLKRGYIHPERPAEERFLIRLGVDDPTFLGAIAALLKPGGWWLIYNICPAPSPANQPFLPWSDGRSPWTREQYQAAGFVVRVFERDDTAATRRMAHLLGWDSGPESVDIEHDLFASYTLLERAR
jgi:hypothetical protein